MSKIPTSLYAETTPNPLVMKFVANRMLVDDGIYEFNNRADASSSPLALELFGFPFVDKVFLSSNFISVTKKENSIEIRALIQEQQELLNSTEINIQESQDELEKLNTIIEEIETGYNNIVESGNCLVSIIKNAE